MVGAPPTVPLPRRPLDPSGPGHRLRLYYENDLGWPTVPGPPLELVVGPRFDVLDVPVEAGRTALRRLAPGSPVAVQGDRMRLLVAPGSADEMPGLLEWLEWGPLLPGLDLVAVGAGAGGVMEAPGVPGPGPEPGAEKPQGAAVWLRPPLPGCEVEASLPTLSAMGGAVGAGRAPDLVRLVDTVAAACHRVRLRRACAQALAFS
ncbi:SCO3374 family protein [Streptomyces sp. NPDC057877]|uniref:SCO3374 family protein n=1 Tax=Streptomyces sp. NPDC057877 TaxID=3346269 RepID=UPI00368B4AF8